MSCSAAAGDARWPTRWRWRRARRPPTASWRRVRPASARRQLTRREKEIAALVADGLGNREIAERLYLSKRTVDSHMEHIFTKLASPRGPSSPAGCSGSAGP